MYLFKKLFITIVLLSLLSKIIYATSEELSKGDIPFPVPLSCYSEDPGTEKYLYDKCDQIREIQHYRDPKLANVAEILMHRISVNPFNLVVSLIFLVAILHTFMANKLTAIAHKIHEEHDAVMKAAGASEEEIKHDIPFKAELFHFLGEVEVIFGIWVIALFFVIVGFYDWNTFHYYIVYDRAYIEPLFVVVIMAIASTLSLIHI